MLTTEDYVALTTYAVRTSEPLKKQAARQRVITTALAFLIPVLVLGVMTQDWVTGLIASALVAVVVWFILPPLNRRHFERNLRRLAAVPGGLGPTGPTRMTIDDAGLHEEIAGMSSSIPWHAVVRVAETAEHAFVLIGPAAGLVIPLRAEHAAQFFGEIRRRSGNAHG